MRGTPSSVVSSSAARLPAEVRLDCLTGPSPLPPVPPTVSKRLTHRVSSLPPEGPKRAAIGAVTCGILLGVIEGAGFLVSKLFFADMTRPQMPQSTFPALLSRQCTRSLEG